jgi:hypothetical protein
MGERAKLGSEYFLGPVKADSHGLMIWAQDKNGHDVHMVDVRGWGYLTGGASLKLDEKPAIEAQRDLQAYIVKAVNAHEAMKAAVIEVYDSIPREYDSEYAGRMETYCTGCGARLTDSDKHHDGCAWIKIDKALSLAEGVE